MNERIKKIEIIFILLGMIITGFCSFATDYVSSVSVGYEMIISMDEQTTESTNSLANQANGIQQSFFPKTGIQKIKYLILLGVIIILVCWGIKWRKQYGKSDERNGN